MVTQKELDAGAQPGMKTESMEHIRQMIPLMTEEHREYLDGIYVRFVLIQPAGAGPVVAMIRHDEGSMAAPRDQPIEDMFSFSITDSETQGARVARAIDLAVDLQCEATGLITLVQIALGINPGGGVQSYLDRTIERMETLLRERTNQ